MSSGLTTGVKKAPRPVTSGLVRQLLAGPDRDLLARVTGKSVAVASGKGGVGKTITACNLSLQYARTGRRVALADLDPLSDVAALLDLAEPEQALDGGRTAGQVTLPVFRGLEILYPWQKLDAGDGGRIMETLFRDRLADLDRRYDLIVFDMPAGSSYEDNLAWLAFVGTVVLVTNPEPTAHASAGAYAKEVQRLYPGRQIHVWHNRFAGRRREGFDPRAIAENYNRLVLPADRLTPRESACLVDIAFVPEDPALDLLQGEPHPAIHVLKCMRDSMEYAQGRLLAAASRRLGVSRGLQDLVTSYILRHPDLEAPEDYLAGFGDFLRGVIKEISGGSGGASPPLPFTAQERSTILTFLRQVKDSALRREMLRLQDALGIEVERLREKRGPFSARGDSGPGKALDKELARLLIALNKAAGANRQMRSNGALLLFYFSLHKLCQSKTLVGIIRSLIPRRKGSRGRTVRDRFTQIRALVERDPPARERYLKAVRALHAISTRQLLTIARALEVPDLLLRDGKGQLDSRAYLRLLGTFIHETVYSGLSVIVGFEYRSAAAAFQGGAERLLAVMKGA
jgi:MinD-like ATPase involved in chromosome partitioning or flagellar assembly